MKDDRSSPTTSQGYRLAGMGVELGGAIGGFCLLGVWIDYHFKSSPRGVVICAILGLIGGMYNFIRQALRASAAQREEDTQAKIDERGPRDPKDD